MVQMVNGKNPEKCAFYWKMKGGGEKYDGNIHYFTAFGLRLVINTIKKKDLWTV